jgi:hypothetical protein
LVRAATTKVIAHSLSTTMLSPSARTLPQSADTRTSAAYLSPFDFKAPDTVMRLFATSIVALRLSGTV